MLSIYFDDEFDTCVDFDTEEDMGRNQEEDIDDSTVRSAVGMYSHCGYRDLAEARGIVATKQLVR